MIGTEFLDYDLNIRRGARSIAASSALSGVRDGLFVHGFNIFGMTEVLKQLNMLIRDGFGESSGLSTGMGERDQIRCPPPPGQLRRFTVSWVRTIDC